MKPSALPALALALAGLLASACGGDAAPEAAATKPKAAEPKAAAPKEPEKPKEPEGPRIEVLDKQAVKNVKVGTEYENPVIASDDSIIASCDYTNASQARGKLVAMLVAETAEGVPAGEVYERDERDIDGTEREAYRNFVSARTRPKGVYSVKVYEVTVGADEPKPLFGARFAGV